MCVQRMGTFSLLNNIPPCFLVTFHLISSTANPRPRSLGPELAMLSQTWTEVTMQARCVKEGGAKYI